MILSILTRCSAKKENNYNTEEVDSVKFIEKVTQHIDSTNEKTKDPFLLDDLFNFESEEALVNEFGANNITRTEEWSAEVEGSWWVSVLFAGTKNEVRFLWFDTEHFENPEKIYHIASAEHKYVSDWETTEGIRLGTTIPELEKLNNGAFSFYGFSWNFEGQVIWNNPERHARGVYVSLRIPEENRMPDLEGNKEISSDSDLARQAKPVVAYIELRKNDQP